MLRSFLDFSLSWYVSLDIVYPCIVYVYTCRVSPVSYPVFIST